MSLKNKKNKLKIFVNELDKKCKIRREKKWKLLINSSKKKIIIRKLLLILI